MTLSRALISILSLSNFIVASKIRPEINNSARVKQHRSGPNGDLVSGEEELRKIIITWKAVPNAAKYEVCHQ